MTVKKTREKCGYFICSQFGSNVVLEVDDYGDWSLGTGWGMTLECTRCGRRITYIGAGCEKKRDVEKKLRKIWRVANECEVRP